MVPANSKKTNGIILAIDAGNTRIKWGVHDGMRWVRQGWTPTAQPESLGSATAGAPAPCTVVVANVAGAEVQRQLAAILPSTPPPQWIASEAFRCGVRNGYDDPAQLGCDRWAALIGAYRIQGGPLLVVNAGTALTVDALTEDGVFLGGTILPGLDLMYRALAENTAALRLQTGKFNAFPTTTGDAIVSGAINGLCGAIERMAHLLVHAGQAEPHCVLSGGGAALLAPHLNLNVKVVDNLVLEGLLTIACDGS